MKAFVCWPIFVSAENRKPAIQLSPRYSPNVVCNDNRDATRDCPRSTKVSSRNWANFSPVRCVFCRHHVHIGRSLCVQDLPGARTGSRGSWHLCARDDGGRSYWSGCCSGTAG